MAVVKSIQFLPEIFRTDTNKKFLNATVDQLISEPQLKKINGYIGRKLAPSFKNTDNYIIEPTGDRQNYQLEPSLIIKDPVTNKIDFSTTYADLINQIKYYGGLTNNHDRLFNGEYYSYDPRVDLDKLINFSQYYWLENGPDSVTVSALGVPLNYTFNVVYDSVTKTYSFTGQDNIPNPTITLARGGVYDFVVNDPGFPFYIQGKPGVLGYDTSNPNINTREVLGVSNNGTDFGVIRFTVPAEDAQDQWNSMELIGSADYATLLSYNDVQGVTPDDLNSILGGLDGTSLSLYGKYLIFVNNEKIDDIYWTGIPFSQRNDIYQIQIVTDTYGVDRIDLLPYTSVNNNQKIKVRAGDTFSGKEFYSNGGLLQPIPYISANLSSLYYQNSAVGEAAGSVTIIDPAAEIIDPDIDIVGKVNYTSPQGIIFTNGLKVIFDSTATESYQNKTYYVEGVGKAIRLILVNNLTADELNGNLGTPDYLTVNRASLDQNAWSRTNRWFHSEVIQKTADYLSTTVSFNQDLRAKRPIIEFEADLQLYNFGTLAKSPVQILDNIITSAYTQIQGIVCASTTGHTFTINGSSVTLTNGDRVVFSNDENNNVRNKIFVFSIVQQTVLPDPVVYKAYIEEAADATVEAGHVLIVQNGDNGGKQWYYNGTSWLSAQQKTKVNQHPLFDIIDTNGVSLAGTSTYPGSSFTGTKIFSYKIGTGANDSILGFPLSYKNFLAQGDIEFVNNYDTDTFEYVTTGGTSGSIKTNSGLLQKNLDRATSIRQNIWTIADNFTKQFQVYDFVYDGVTNLFPIDDLPDRSNETPNIKVYVNNKNISTDNFAITQVVDRYAVLVNQDILVANDEIFVLLYNSTTDLPNAYYQVPTNLDINGQNTNLNTLTLGQMRNHLVTIKNKSLAVIGDVPGNSNLRDVTYTNKGGSILQHSAPVMYSSLFLTHPTMNFVNSLKLANHEYSKFKIKFLELAANLDLDRTNIAECVDSIVSKINDLKNNSFPWYYSDMIPYAAMGFNKIEYAVLSATIRSYEISSIFQDLVLQNKAVLVYLTRTVNAQTTTILLVKNKDFYFDQTRPAITFYDNFTLLYGDKIDIVEYSNTDGSYIPETPTKLGLYPKFIPEIYTDNTYRTPIQVIQGHDGSITPCFGDYRDDILLELERRIYNNLKIDYNPNNFNLYDYIPGKFRGTGYTNAEFNQILSTSFFAWAGTNKVDYTTNNVFKSSDPFTWNYKNFLDSFNGESLPGAWRSIFRYYYDTDRPHTHPWEMLGFSQKPDYWDGRYGPAPYTGGNAILWSDLSQGYIHAGARAGFDIRYLRPNLNFIIPVDESGNLKPPTTIGGVDPNTGITYALVTDFASDKANISYALGDGGPAETAWRRSSEYPFAMNLALALTKPARYFSLLSNITNYYRDSITAQFLVENTGQHLTPELILINGYTNGNTIERSAGYLNWIIDYVKNLGIENATYTIKDNLSKLSVQLAYKIGGYTDKKFITLLAEQSSPTSVNDSIVIPDENYRIELYKSTPITKAQYSAVIIEKSDAGYTVSGYSTSNPYFFIIPSLPNNNSYVVTQGNSRAVIYKDYKKTKLTIPYGFEFNTKQQVVDFLVGYQRYLIAQGFVFTDTESVLNETQDWVLSSKEFLHWVNQGWRTGSVLVLTPIKTTLKFYNNLAVVDEVKNIPFGSRVVDINNKVIKKNNFTVYRENNLFTIQSNGDQSIGFAELNVVQYEHLLILDNQTVFNDIIYAPELGNRQYRLKLLGARTDNWNGSLELPGFIYNSPNIDAWGTGIDYLKGTIVEHKAKYYTALQNVVAADKFQVNDWKLITSSELKSGMTNNFATNAGQSLQFYDIDNQPFNEELQLFSNGLIGFRNRKFFSDLGIDTTTQSKFYQGLIKQKGTLNSVIALKGAKFNNINTDINIYENWAVRVGEYGSIDDNQYVEVALDERQITNNPTAIQFVDSTITASPDAITYTFNDLYKISGDWDPNLFRTKSLAISNDITPLPVAGYVYQADIDSTLVNLSNYQDINQHLGNIGTGWKLWVARNFSLEWDVLRASIIHGILFAIRYSIDSDAEFVHNEPHGLKVNDVIVIKNFDTKFNGAYKVKTIVDSTRFTVELYQNLNTLINLQAVVGQGILYKLTSMRVDYATDIESIKPSQGWVTNDKVWVDNLDNDLNWGVYNKTDPWNYNTKFTLNESQYQGSDHFGGKLSLSADGLVLYSAAPNSGPGKVSVFLKDTVTQEYNAVSLVLGRNSNLSYFGGSLSNGNNFLAVGAHQSYSNQGLVYIYKDQLLQQVLIEPTGTAGDKFGYSSAMSADGKFLYIGAPGANAVYCYALATQRQQSNAVYHGNGVNTTYTLPAVITDATGVVIYDPLSSAELIPLKDYTIAQITNGVTNYSFSGTPPSTLGLNFNVSATGGSGSGALFDVSVTLVGPGVFTAFTPGKTYKIATAGTTDFVAVGAADNNPGTVFVATGTGIIPNQSYTTGTAYTCDLTLSNAGSGYAAGNTLTIAGAAIGGVTPTNNITINVISAGAGTNVIFTAVPSATQQYQVYIRSYYYELIETLPVASEAAANSNFGYSVSCNSEGTSIVVGAPNEIIGSYASSGAIYLYHRTVTEFITNGVTGTFEAPNAFNTIRSVKLNNVELLENTDYYIVGSSVQFATFSTPAKAQQLRVETNQFILDQRLVELSGNEHKFGSYTDFCSTGCNIVVSAPDYTAGGYQFGAVARIINVGRIYGSIIGTVSNPTVTPGHSLTINNVNIKFLLSTLDSVVSSINAANIPGVTAENSDNKLKITSRVVTPGQKLDIKQGVGTPFADLGIDLYKLTQVIMHPETIGEKFGTAVALNSESTVLAVGSQGGDITVPTSFDNENTTFDTLSTAVVDFIKDSGSVYIYDLIDNPFASFDNPSIFTASQKLYGPDLQTGYDFGESIKLNNSALFVGVANDNEFNGQANGSVYYYSNAAGLPGWNLIRYKQPRVDLDAVNSVFTYDSESSLLVNYFDFIDPAKGKILGVVDQEIDYREIYDPASYNSASGTSAIKNLNFYWTDRHVGKTWWDLSLMSVIDYEQESLAYRSKNWGAFFPGSQIKIYEWVKSSYLPSQYVAAGGDGVPKFADDSAYSLASTVDPVTGVIVQYYYYWVGSKTTVDPVIAKRSLSTKSLESYILNPKDQGIPYVALLSPNSIAIYNSNDNLRSNKIILHLDLGKSKGQNLIHSEYELIQEGNGLQVFPQKIIDKIRDSLAGFDAQGAIVPDVLLNVQDRYGLSFIPRQSVFVNRTTALSIFTKTVNNILYQYPILLITTPTTLYAEEPLPTTGFDAQVDSASQLSYLDENVLEDGYKVLVPNDPDYNNKWTIYEYKAATSSFQILAIQPYKTPLFWDPMDWYASDYDLGSKIDFIVPTYGDIQSVSYTAGDLIKVLDNGNGQWLIYLVLDNLTLSLKGAENATLSIKDSIYDVTLGSGFDSTLFETTGFDPQIGKEFVSIYESVHTEILIKDLAIKFNDLFFAMINFLFSEQKSPDWIFKTSFIDAYHNLRKLEQIPNYIKDDQTFYENYINEIKPYRTKLKDYLPIYDAVDTATGDWTDFNLPSVYNATTGTFSAPSDLTILSTTSPYNEWYNHHTYVISDFLIGNVGIGYAMAPNVEITGGGGSGATAITTINPSTQEITGVIVTNPGSGYTSTPTITINGIGSGAIVYPLLKNQNFAPDVSLSYNLVRTTDTTLKFDRILYNSEVQVWQPNVVYAETIITTGTGTGNLWIQSGNIISYRNEPFIAKSTAYLNGAIFDYTLFEKLDSSNVLLKTTDRIKVFYQPDVGMPNNSFSELMSGIDYPGAKVTAAKFTANSFEISSNTLSFNYIGLTVTSANIEVLDFQKLGFEIDNSIRISTNYDFDFKNNGYFKIISVDNGYMRLSGEVIETTYRMLTSTPITVYSGDIITQANTPGNAYVLNDSINSTFVDVIHTTTGFQQTVSVGSAAETYPIVTVGSAENIYVNGVLTLASVREITTGGNANVTISYLELDTSILDSNIYSKYLDTALGTRPEDINIVGGAYVDTYNSHAPEELVPGRMYDALEVRVFSNNSANTSTYGYRIFQPMIGNPEFTRISANSTAVLSRDLAVTDSFVFVNDVTTLPAPNPDGAVPGVVFINGERIHYYQIYSSVDIAFATTWVANVSYTTSSLLSVDLGTLYSNVVSNVAGVTFDVRAYTTGYAASLNTSNIEVSIGDTFTVTGNKLGGTAITNDASIEITTDGLEVFYTVTGTPADPESTTYKVLGNVYANANAYINSANIQMIYPNTLTQLRRSVSGTGANIIHAANSLVVDSSLQQIITDSACTASNVYTAGNLTTSGNVNVTYKMTLTEPITANLGDYITQFSNANARVLDSVTNSNVVAVNLDTTRINTIVTETITVVPVLHPWEANTIAISANLSINSQDGSTNDLFFKPDGTKMYSIGSSTDRVYEYTLGSAWDITTASNVAAVSISAQETVGSGLFFKSDGTKMYIIGSVQDRVFEYTLSTPWSVNTASNVGTSVTTSTGGATETTPTGLFFKSDGTSYYILGSNEDRVKRYDMTTPWQVNTAAYYSQSASFASIETTSSGLSFHPDGLKMFVVGSSNDRIREYDLATAWDPSTITLVASSSILFGTSPVPQGMFWKPDGTRVFISDSSSDQINAYDTTTTYANTVAYSYTYTTTDFAAPVVANAAMFRVNIASTTSTTTTTANILALTPLGTINANGNITATTIIGNIITSNLWIPVGTGVGLENSTLDGAIFIREEPSYIP